jgi:hypothetical protein
MERGNPTKSGRMQGARPFAYFWWGRPSGRLPKVSRRKGGTVTENTTSAADSLNSSDSHPKMADEKSVTHPTHY